jgi:hypothetical protein
MMQRGSYLFKNELDDGFYSGLVEVGCKHLVEAHHEGKGEVTCERCEYPSKLLGER